MSNDNNSPPPPYTESQEKSAHITIADSSFPPVPQAQQQPSAPSAPQFQAPHVHPHVHANTGEDFNTSIILK